MTATNFNNVVRMLLDRQPFRPFVIELRSGRRVEVDVPDSTAIRDGTAIVLGNKGKFELFDHTSVVQIVAPPEHDTPHVVTDPPG